jgi:hypothetical protein
LLGGRKRSKTARALGLIGISRDEAQRMRDSGLPYIDHAYPLVDAGISRQGCKRLLEEAGCPVPGKSSCIFCPYHSDAFWWDLKENHPVEFARAVAVDRMMRDMSAAAVKEPGYLHAARMPLEDVDLGRWRDIDGQRYLFEGFGNECEGMCGV